jgi:hypothetical protein
MHVVTALVPAVTLTDEQILSDESDEPVQTLTDAGGVSQIR